MDAFIDIIGPVLTVITLTCLLVREVLALRWQESGVPRPLDVAAAFLVALLLVVAAVRFSRAL